MTLATPRLPSAPQTPTTPCQFVARCWLSRFRIWTLKLRVSSSRVPPFAEGLLRHQSVVLPSFSTRTAARLSSTRERCQSELSALHRTAAQNRRARHLDCREHCHVIGFGQLPLQAAVAEVRSVGGVRASGTDEHV